MTAGSRRVLLLAAAFIVASPAAMSSAVGGMSPAAGAASPFEREDVRAVTSRIACTCGCPHMQVSECFCGVADEVRASVAAQLDQGEPPDSIVAAYVEEHGTWALAVPPREGFNWSIWLLPPVLLVFGVIGLLVLGRRWAGSRAGPVPALAAADEDRYRAALEREIAEGD